MWAGYWYSNVHASSGFNSIEDKGQLQAYRRFPPSLFPLLRACLPFYEALAAHAIRPSADSSSIRCVRLVGGWMDGWMHRGA